MLKAGCPLHRFSKKRLIVLFEYRQGGFHPHGLPEHSASKPKPRGREGKVSAAGHSEIVFRIADSVLVPLAGTPPPPKPHRAAA